MWKHFLLVVSHPQQGRSQDFGYGGAERGKILRDRVPLLLSDFRMVHAFTCAGMLPSQYDHMSQFVGIGCVGHNYIRRGKLPIFILGSVFYGIMYTSEYLAMCKCSKY